MPPHSSLPRRLLLPLTLSLLAHVLLVTLLALLTDPPSAAGTTTAAAETSSFSLSLVWLENPKPPQRLQTVPQEKELVIPIRVTPRDKPLEGTSLPAVDAASTIPKEPASPTGTPPGAGTGNVSPTGAPTRGLLAAPASAHSIVYLVDCSMSMGPSGALATARHEVAASLRRLSAHVLFQIIPYNTLAEPLPLNGRHDLVPATPASVEQAIELLQDVRAAGATDHARALRRALLLRPDLLFLVTDAGDLKATDVPALIRLNRRGTALHVIELAGGSLGRRPTCPLAQLAQHTGGSYRRVPPER
jgi:hypothetical protein